MQPIIYIFNFIVVSYNQPNLPSCAKWSPPAGITWADLGIGFRPTSIFVDTNNTLYVIDRYYGELYVWHNNSSKAIVIYLLNFNPMGLFVTIDGNIYVGNGKSNTVEKWTLDTTEPIIVMNVSNFCYGLFVDINNNIYCSLEYEYKVVKQSLDGDINDLETIAGTGKPGNSSNMLENPRGIFVDVNFDLYIADCYNHRIQFFKAGHLNGITVAGDGAPFRSELDGPGAVFLDANQYLFIIDQHNRRIVKMKSDEFLLHCWLSG